MDSIKKLAWYGAVAVASLAVAVALLVSGPVDEAEAAAGSVGQTSGVVGGTPATVTVTDTDLIAGGFVTFTIIGGTAAATFTANSATTISCADAVAAGTCDQNITTPGAVSVQISGTTAGSLVVSFAVWDAADGYDGAGPAGDGGTINVTLTNPLGTITATATPTTINAAPPAPFNQSVIAVTVKDTSGANAPNGTTVNAVTSLGTFLSTGTQIASGVTAAGVASFTLVGAGLPGTATVTVSSGTLSTTVSVVVAGSVASMTASLGSSNVAAGAANVPLTVTIKDAAGNPKAGEFATSTVTSPTAFAVGTNDIPGSATNNDCNDGLEGTNSAGQCIIHVTIPAAAAVGPHVIKVTSSTTATVTATVTINIASPLDVVTVAIGDVDANGLATITVTALGTNGSPAANAAAGAIIGATSAGAVVGCTGITDGVGTCTLVAPTTPQTVTVTAIVTIGTVTKTGSAQAAVGGATPPPSGGGSFTGDIADSGVSAVLFDGGTVADLAAATSAAGAVSVWVTSGGSLVGLIPGAPSFVNAAFNALYADGNVPANTIVIVVK